MGVVEWRFSGSGYLPSATASPNPVGLRTSNKFEEDVVVTIAWSGTCIPLVLTFDPDTLDNNTTLQQEEFDVGTTVTIGKNDHTWRKAGSGDWTFPLQVRQGSNGTVMATINLVLDR